MVLGAVLRVQRHEAAVGTGEERGRIVVVLLELVVQLDVVVVPVARSWTMASMSPLRVASLQPEATDPMTSRLP